MAGKEGPPLYEFVHRSQRSAKRAMALPEWMGSDADQEQTAEASSDAVTEGLTAADSAPEPTHEPAAPITETRSGSTITKWTAWMKRPVGMRLPRGTWVMLGMGAFVLVLIVFFVGRKVGRNSMINQQRDYSESVAGIDRAREQPIRTDLIPPSVAGTDDRLPPGSGTAWTGGGNTGSREIDDVPPPPAHAGASGNASDPREPGLNYYRLTAMPAGAEEVGRIIAFLSENGVDAAAIPIQNGRSVKMVALRGFERPLSDPAAQQFEQRLRSLGRKWKAQHRGSSDWKDLFPEKYRPGRT